MATNNLFLTPGQRSKGWKIYLTTDNGRWVIFDSSGIRKGHDGQTPIVDVGRQPNLGTSLNEAWDFAERVIREYPEIARSPLSYLTPYRNEPQRPILDYAAQRPFPSFVHNTVVSESRPSLFDETRNVELYERPNRPNQVIFRNSVLERYGERCAFCRISSIELLDAAHIVAWVKNGSDIPENGLVLCSLHHRALDRGMIRIDPSTMVLHSRRIGPSLRDLHVEQGDIAGLPAYPRIDALEWLWSENAE